MKSCRSTLIARGGVLVLSAAAVGPVTAQTTSAVLDEIVVTARRVEESLQKVPVAVSALSGETLQQRAVVAVDDIMRSVPSVNFGTGTRSSSTPFFGIRGINSSDLVGALDPAVGIYQNEVIMQRPNGVLSSLYDVQSVQVLRGPQGTLFGRNTVGGAILVTSRKPEEEFGGYITGSYGDFDYLNFEGAVNIPLADWAQLRVAGRMVDRDGYVKSDITGQDQSNLGSDAYRVTLALQPTEAISSITYYDWFKQDTNGVGAVSRGLIPPGTFIGSGVVNVNSNVSDAGNRGAIANAGTVGRDDFYRNLSNEDQEDYTKAWNLSNTTTIKLNETFSVKNIVGYRDVDYHSSVDLDSSIGRILTVGTENSTHQVSEELQFLGRWDKFDFIVGGYYFREKGTDVAPS